MRQHIHKIIKSQTIKDSFISLIGAGFAAAAGTVFTIIMARTLGPAQFGIFSAVTALATIIYSIGDLGISTALVNFLPKNPLKRQEYITTSFWFQFTVGVLVFTFFFTAGYFANLIIPGSIPIQLRLVGFLAVNYLLLNYFQSIFTAERRFVTYSLSQIIDAAIRLTIVIALVLGSHLSIATAIIANVVSSLVSLLITSRKELWSTEWGFDKDIFAKIAHFAKWIGFSRFFSVLISRVDVVLLNLLSTSIQAGLYAAASRITFLFVLVVSSLGSVVGPRYSGFKKVKEVIAYSKKLFVLLIAVSAAMLLCAVFAQPIIAIVFGDKYLPSVVLFRYLTVAMLPFIFSIITNQTIIYTYNQPHFYAWVTAIQVTSMVLLEILLIPRVGSIAPVIAVGATNVFVLSVSSIKFAKLLRHEPK